MTDNLVTIGDRTSDRVAAEMSDRLIMIHVHPLS